MADDSPQANSRPPAWNIYAQQLLHHRYGYPLWMPEYDPRLGEIEIGDVGWIAEGGFYPLFNTLKSMDDSQPRGVVPEGHEPMDPSSVIISDPRKIVTQPLLCGGSIKQVKASATLTANGGVVASNSPSVGAHFGFECSTDAGAFLLLAPPAVSRQIQSKKHIADYMRRNFVQWTELANSRFGLGLKDEEIVYVSGTTKTTKWAVAAFHGEYRRKEGSITADFGSLMGIDISVSISNEMLPSSYYRTGPAREPEPSESAVIVPIMPPPQERCDQCIFLHYYKMKRRLGWKLTPMRAAGGPHELPPPDTDDGDDVLSTSLDSDQEGSIIDEVFGKPFDPVNDILDYILEHSQASTALAGVEDLYELFEELPSSVRDALLGRMPCIEVDGNGVGFLSTGQPGCLSDNGPLRACNITPTMDQNYSPQTAYENSNHSNDSLCHVGSEAAKVAGTQPSLSDASFEMLQSALQFGEDALHGLTNLSILSKPRKSKSLQELSVGVAQQRISSPSSSLSIPFTPYPNILLSELFTPEDVKALFKIYYQWINPIIPMLNEDIHTPASVLARSTFLFIVICTVASRYYKEKPYIHPAAIPWVDAAAANALIHGLKTVDVCQAFVLWGMYHRPTRWWEEDHVRRYTGVAFCNLATKLIAERFTDVRDERARHSQTQMWLVCFIMDRCLSIQSGKAWTVREDTIIQNAASWLHNFKDNNQCDSYLTNLAGLLVIMSRFVGMVNFAYNTGTVKSVDVLALYKAYDNELIAWKAVVDKHHRGGKVSRDPANVMQITLIHYMQLTTKNMISKRNELFAGCLRAAISLVNFMVEDFVPGGLVPYFPEFVYSHSVFAAVFLLKCVRPEGNTYMVLTQLEERIIELLWRLITVWTSDDIPLHERHSTQLHAKFLSQLMDPYLARLARKKRAAPPVSLHGALPSIMAPRQPPTITNMRIRSVRDAEIILHAVSLNRLPMVLHRLADEERLALRPGCIYVWEERSSNPLEATEQEIQRFTEGRSWGPSRARDNFLVYYEKDSLTRSSILHRNNIRTAPQLIKQTYSVFIDYPKNSRKWHLNAYYTQESFEALQTVDDIPCLQDIEVPRNRYVCARNNGGRRRERQGVADSMLPPFAYDSSSSPSSSPREGFYPTPYPLQPSPSHTLVPPAALLPSGFVLSDRRLAPLEYLQNISPKA